MTMSNVTDRVRRVVAASAVSAVLMVGTAAAAAAQTAPDQHAGGVSPNNESVDPGSSTDVLGRSLSRDAGGSGSGGLPITGADVVALVVAGGAAIGIGSTAVVASRRRTTRATA